MSETQPIVPLLTVRQNGHRYLLSASRVQLEGIGNALNEICNGVHIEDPEFQSRLGATREELQAVLKSLSGILCAEPSGDFETVKAWADGCSVQARCMSAYGDPVDMSSIEARKFAHLLIECADKADSM